MLVRFFFAIEWDDYIYKFVICIIVHRYLSTYWKIYAKSDKSKELLMTCENPWDYYFVSSLKIW